MKTCKPIELNIIKNRTLAMHKNESGFTLVELLIASAISLVLLAVLAQVVQFQGNSFVLQNQLNQMQTNGRASTEFISRAVANAGYNVFRGTRFLAASDHYISTSFDEDDDGVIQNDEVMTFATGNDPGATFETINIQPYFDRDGDGAVSAAETANFPIPMTVTAPPFNLYKILPDNSGAGVTRHLMARNIDNVVMRYYDKNNNPLPIGVAVDAQGLPIPPYNFNGAAAVQLNDIRRVDIEVLSRTKDLDPNSRIENSGDYVTGSVATLGGIEPTAYSDGYHREKFNANQAPRNLVLAPWGKMDVEANPPVTNCPNLQTSVTATLVDAAGNPLDGASVHFVASTGATVSLPDRTTNSSGQASTPVFYDWKDPSASITVSASTLISSNGLDFPVFNSNRANFLGLFNDNFTDDLEVNWVELDNAADIVAADTDLTPGNDALRMSATGLTRAVNGCQLWQDFQVEFEFTPSGDIDTGAIGPAMVGGYLRYQDAGNNYSAIVEKTAGNCLPGDGLPYCLRIVKWNGALTTLGTVGANLNFTAGIKYKLVAQMEGQTLRAKVWNANLPADPIPGLGLADPNPGIWVYNAINFPTVYPVTATDTDYANGQTGLIGDWTVAVDVDIDNFAVTRIN